MESIMRNDDELRNLMEQVSCLHLLPPGRFAKRFLAVCGDCTGEELHRLGELFRVEAGRALVRAEAAEKELNRTE
jgi:hypothetical protein